MQTRRLNQTTLRTSRAKRIFRQEHHHNNTGPTTQRPNNDKKANKQHYANTAAQPNNPSHVKGQTHSQAVNTHNNNTSVARSATNDTMASKHHKREHGRATEQPCARKNRKAFSDIERPQQQRAGGTVEHRGAGRGQTLQPFTFA